MTRKSKIEIYFDFLRTIKKGQEKGERVGPWYIGRNLEIPTTSSTFKNHEEYLRENGYIIREKNEYFLTDKGRDIVGYSERFIKPTRLNILETYLGILNTVKKGKEKGARTDEEYIRLRMGIRPETFRDSKALFQEHGLLKEEGGEYSLTAKAMDVVAYSKRIFRLDENKASIFSEIFKGQSPLSSEADNRSSPLKIIKKTKHEKTTRRSRRTHEQMVAEFLKVVEKHGDEGVNALNIRKEIGANYSYIRELARVTKTLDFIREEDGRYFIKGEGRDHLNDPDVRAYLKNPVSSEDTRRID